MESFRSFAQKILKLARPLPIQIFIRVKKGLLVRFANNGVHQNGFQDLFTYTLRLITKSGPVYVESNDLSEKGMRESLGRLRLFPSEEKAGKKRKPNLHRSKLSLKENFPLNSKKTPEMAANTVQEALELIRGEQASANGYYSAYQRIFFLTNSEGLERSHCATAVRFGVTITKGAGKGYFSFYHPNPGKFQVKPVVRKAIELAETASRGEIRVSPGEYECIFSPRAFLELIEPLRRHFDRNLTEDGKSVFSGTLGKKIVSPQFSLHENVYHSRQFGVPFDSEGDTKKKVTLIQRGILKELLAEGSCTRGISEHPFSPQNLVVERGEISTLKELFRQIRKGVFINKIWYHTLVREDTMEVTGLATAGSLYIERGQVRGRVIHLRYHDSLFSILRSVAGATREQILLKDGEFGAALFPYLWVSRLKVV